MLETPRAPIQLPHTPAITALAPPTTMATVTGPSLPIHGIVRHLPAGGLIALVWAAVLLSGMFVAARIMIRNTRVGRLEADDRRTYLAYLVLVVNAVLQTLQTPHVYYLAKAQSGLPPLELKFISQGNEM